jgi:glucose/arabinose dehydrogenase
MTHIHRRISTVVVGALIAASCSAAHPAASSPRTGLVDIGAGIKGPDGLHATVYASGLTHAAVFASDARHRLWVATADYTDAGQDGVYLVSTPNATPVEVITGLHTPLGLLWYQGTLYVAAKGGVVAYSDLRGTRFAARRTIVTLPSGVGEVNNIVLAPDGRMLVGISSPCDHCTPASRYSGSIVSFRPDGRDLQIYASGIRAPVGLTYVPRTSDLLVTMNQRDDLGAQTTGDALAVVRAGTAWGSPRCYGQGGAECRGVPSTTAVLDQHAAVSGVAILTGRLGSTFGTSAIVAEWALGKVQRVALEKSGGTYRGVVTTFLTGPKNPVAVNMTADGALLVGDWTTGTIYRVAAS